MQAPVDVRIEIHSLVLNFIKLCQRKHLKSAAVRKNGLVPRHKLVQTAGGFYYLVARTHIQVVGICQNNLRIRLF